MTEKTREKLEYKLNCYVNFYAHRDYVARQQKNKKRISGYSLSDEALKAVEMHRLALYPISADNEKRIKAYLLLHLRNLDEAEKCLAQNQPSLYKHYQKIGLTS